VQARSVRLSYGASILDAHRLEYFSHFVESRSLPALPAAAGGTNAGAAPGNLRHAAQRYLG